MTHLQRGGTVVLYLPGHSQSMLAFWACVLAGLVPCFQPTLPIGETQRLEHLQHLKKTLGDPVFLTDGAYL